VNNQKKPKICLIYTGGTIGMIRSKENGLRPPLDPKDFLKVAPEIADIVDFDFVPLLNKDSTNINPNDWKNIAKAIYERRGAGYKGFVIAHGTDTMHFTSSALAFAFGSSLNFPIVVTGSQTIPEVIHGDAKINLLRACKVACSDLAEVVISFGDYIFRGCRVQKKDERRFDAFESPAFFPIGYISESIELTPLAQPRVGGEHPKMIDFCPEFEEGILQVSLIPGLKPDLLIPSIESEHCKGVILQSFGAGNVPNEGEYSFIPLIKLAKKLNKPTIITSQFPGHATDNTDYQAGIEAHRAGGIPTGNMTSSAAYVKFSWILAQVLKEIRNQTVNDEEKLFVIKERMNRTIYVREMDAVK